MYYYGGSCGQNNYQPYPMYYYGGYSNYGTSNYAIVLVLFILLVIVIGSRANNR
jgi:hypothetical protein